MEEKTKSGANHYKMVQMLIKILPCAALATGAIFIYTLGTFDISLGAATLFAAMMSVLSAVAGQIITTKGGALGGISIPGSVLAPFDHIGVKLVILGAFVAVCVFVFDFTKVGRRQKFIGGNPVCAALSGIESDKYTILAFVMSGLGVGVGAFLTLVYTPSVTTTTASSIGMNIFIAIVFGGMPISGGARSKIYAALIGGFSFMLLNDILELVIDGSAAYGMTQLVSAVCFLLVADVSGEEALGFRSYYENYIANHYDVEFSYTDALESAEDEKIAIEKFASQGCDAIISLASNDRAQQIETCEKYGVYYAIASGVLDDEQYETYKKNLT